MLINASRNIFSENNWTSIKQKDLNSVAFHRSNSIRSLGFLFSSTGKYGFNDNNCSDTNLTFCPLSRTFNGPFNNVSKICFYNTQAN